MSLRKYLSQKMRVAEAFVGRVHGWAMNNCRFAQESAVPQVRSLILTNPKGRKFFTLYGNTRAIKDDLSDMGFRYFEGRWGTAVDFIAKDMGKRQRLESLGVDTSMLDDPSVLEPAAKPTEDVAAPAAAADPTPTEKYLAKMKAGVQKAMQGASGKSKDIFAYVDGVIDDLANQVDEQASSEFVRSFLDFASRFYNYSFSNQMLIWIQNPKATNVAGATDWFDKFGREVVDRDEAIEINAPIVATSREGDALKKTMPKEQWEAVRGKYQYVRFKGVKVYDISSTRPIEGWVGPKGEKPFEPKEWRQDPNEAMDELTDLINSGLGWARSKGINVDSEEMEGSMGGYSKGGEVRINSAYDGINKFSTLVHELAHEVLHWAEEYKDRRTGEGRKEREIDAETVAYIVLKHYGFETKDSPRYLALWQAKGEDVRKRRDNISKAVKQIVNGMDSSMEESGTEME